jgi:Zn-dependent peptidase ImmA (M78 family)
MDKVPELFSFKDFIYKEKWNRIIKRIAREFLVTEEAASVKIEEILMFPNIYYPKKEIEGNVKSLS